MNQQHVAVVGPDPWTSNLVALLRPAGHKVTSVGADLQSDALAEADVVLVTGPDDQDVAGDLCARAAQAAGREALVVGVTSGLSVTGLAAGVLDTGRFAGLVVHDQVEGAATIEVVRAEATDDATIEALVSLVESLPGRTAVVVQDRPGFLLNSMLLPYLNDVVNALADGLASIEDIDVALHLGLGYRTGPLAMLDRIGLDNHLRTTEAVHEQTRDQRYAPPPLLRRMVDAGRVGGASGNGFHKSERTN